IICGMMDTMYVLAICSYLGIRSGIAVKCTYSQEETDGKKEKADQIPCKTIEDSAAETPGQPGKIP
ncbi:MAG: hypothetical protein LUC32_00450, partial [Clostridiales bacterium]|nr:hypothetical protein [Clostridiales bacterium]